MSRKATHGRDARATGKSALVVCLVVLTAVLLSGCAGPSADMKLQFTPEQTGQYESTVLVVKDFRFEQPNVEKLREEQTKTEVVMGFDQTIESVDASGVATARVTIKDLKIVIVNKNEEKFAFDSSKEESKSSPFTALIGQSYTIKLTPDGKASAVDVQAVNAAVKSGDEMRVAESLFDEKAVSERHSIPGLPEEKQEGLSAKSTWTKVVASPPGLLAPKNFAKTYVVKQIKNEVATVEMKASESGEAAGIAGGGMGMFAKMFDNEDVYTGTMQLNVANGDVLLSEETLVSSYIAQETPENGDPAKGPDTLVMRFTNTNKLAKR